MKRIPRKRTDELFRFYKQWATANPELAQKLLNGAGPTGYGTWIRDRLCGGLVVTEAANAHDLMFNREHRPTGVTFREANAVFLMAMLDMNKAVRPSILRLMNIPLIFWYYFCVSTAGKLFWRD